MDWEGCATRRFYDFNVWSRKKKIEKLAYMHMNPVKRGLVARPDHWLWSSCKFYQGQEEILIGIDPVVEQAAPVNHKKAPPSQTEGRAPEKPKA